MTLAVHSVTFDAVDAVDLARFWAAALNLRIADGATREFAVAERAGSRYLFIAVPEPKTAKNRVHLDLEADDRETEVERLLGLGATRLDDLEEDGAGWTVLSDPEGNEFCVVQARATSQP
jgi:predicted enzyme related to lactoylglutathione lyase